MFTPQLAVLGAGLMGVGIACHFARHGHTVRLYDTDPARVSEIPGVAAAILRELEECEQFDAAQRTAVLSRLSGTTALGDLADATLLIEAIPERLALKHALYRELETLIADEAIIASNTSGYAASGTLVNRPLLASAAFYPAGGSGAGQRNPAASRQPGQRFFILLLAGSGSTQPRRAGVRRQPTTVRPAARSAAYR